VGEFFKPRSVRRNYRQQFILLFKKLCNENDTTSRKRSVVDKSKRKVLSRTGHEGPEGE
jgi:hypothetical protein